MEKRTSACSSISTPEQVEPLKLPLPIGFRFLPTDQELLVDYLHPRALGSQIPTDIISEVDLYNYQPLQLRDMSANRETEFLYFYTKDSPETKSAVKRIAGDGSWEATGAEESVIDVKGTEIGSKRAFNYHYNNGSNGTAWTMEEYRLCDEIQTSGQQTHEWVLVKVYEIRNEEEEPENDVEDDDRVEEID